MRLRIAYILPLTLSLVAMPIAAQSNDAQKKAIRDSLEKAYDFDELEMQSDTAGKTQINRAKGFNAYEYVLENRYLNRGDQFTKRWNDHLFMQVGVGAERIIPPSSQYKYDALMGAHLAIGKQFDRLNSLRLSVNGNYGYQRQFDYTFFRIGGKLDYIFSLSDYFGGYDPMRRLNLSAIVGAGYQYAKRSYDKSTASAPEAHIGVQMRFFTGPQAYIALEPYIGMGGDQLDLSANHNWRSYDAFYGVNLSFIYYLRNNLSPQAKLRILKERSKSNYLSTDSLPQSWRQPWFVEVTNGLAFNNDADLGMGETMGHEVALSLGKWLSPMIGFRLSAFSRSNTWRKEKDYADHLSTITEYERFYHSVYAGGRVEGMLNPFGISKNYNWDSQFGAYLTFGVEYGHLAKYESNEKLSCNSEGFTIGAHLWAKLTPDLQLFIEPRYYSNQYNVPFTNNSWYERYAEKGLVVNAGVTMLMRTRKYRDARLSEGFKQRHFVIGVEGGTSLMQTSNATIKQNSHFAYNYGGFMEYHFGDFSGVRASFQYMQRQGDTHSRYWDIYTGTDGKTAAYLNKFGRLWNHKYTFGLASLSYDANLTTLMGGPMKKRLFELEAFAGPTYLIVMKSESALDPIERLTANHKAVLEDPVETKSKFGMHVGVKLMANISSHFAVTLSPTYYFINGLEMNGFRLPKLGKNFSCFETINIGFEYKL